jgi:HEAT repeat protein
VARQTRSPEVKLARLRELRDAALTTEAKEEIRRALSDPVNVVAAEAAKIVGREILAEFAPELLAAFEHFMVDPVKRDRNCTAKIAVAEALDNIEHDDPEIFLRGIRYVQEEPVWGGREDSAAPLRSICAAALVRINHADALPLLIDLLADPERTARMGAAYALASSGKNSAMLLLRLKARLGDAEPDVTAECLNGLLRLAPKESLPFVAEFLRSPDRALQEATLLSLGSSRVPEAFDVLKEFLEGFHSHELRETALLAMALLRLPVATEFLVSLVAEGPVRDAAPALAALAVFRHDPAIVTQRPEPALAKTLAQKFQAD